jgi:hypothetical protein
VHDRIVLELTRQPDLDFNQMRTAGCRRELEKPGPRTAPNRAIARLGQRIDGMHALPIVASESLESHLPAHRADIERKQTLVGTDEVPVAAGAQKGPDSGRTQTVVAAKRHGDLAIEPYQTFSGAEPYESEAVASNALQLVAWQAVGGRQGAHRQALRRQRRHGGEGDHARDDGRA